MDTIINIGAMFGVMIGTLIVVAVAYYAFDRWAFPMLEFSDELRAGNLAVAVFLAAVVLGMFLLAARATAAPLRGASGQALERYDDSFREHARIQFGYAYDWQWFKAQGMTESNLDPHVCSQVGACGVMQFMPGTALAMGLQDRFDAKASIRAGIAYDRRLWRQWSAPRPTLDRLQFAFASYNAGLGHVLRFQREAAITAPGGEANLWAVVAPHAWAEPRDYVQRIGRWQVRFAGGR